MGRTDERLAALENWLRRKQQERLGRIPTAPRGGTLDPYEVAVAPIPNKTTIREMQDRLRRRYPFRFARIQADMRWLEKQHHKFGVLDPQDMRWYV